jgi:hypothetical protein
MQIPILTLILVWNGMGRCNPADCNHHVSFRTWHFLCKKTRLSEARRRAGTPDRNSQLVRAMFPGSGARLSCNHHSKRRISLAAQYCSRSPVKLDAGIVCRMRFFRLFSKLSNFEQTREARHRNFNALTRRERARL